MAKKVAINVAGNVAGNVANQAISKGVKKISAKEAAVAGATGILDVAGNAAGTALKKAGSKAVCKIAGAAAEGAGAIAAKKAGAKAAQKALGTSAEAGLAGAGKNAVSSQQGLGKKLLDGIDNLKSTGKALLKDEGGFLDLDALAGKKSVSGAVGKSGSNTTRRQAFREAKEAAGIPKSAEYKTHKFVFDGTSENRIVYEFDVCGEKKYIIEHPFDKMGRGNHFHGADDTKGSPFSKGRYNQYPGHFPEDFNGFN